jgi:hypothetical protein
MDGHSAGLEGVGRGGSIELQFLASKNPTECHIQLQVHRCDGGTTSGGLQGCQIFQHTKTGKIPK